MSVHAGASGLCLLLLWLAGHGVVKLSLVSGGADVLNRVDLVCTPTPAETSTGGANAKIRTEPPARGIHTAVWSKDCVRPASRPREASFW
jgi:hypothetical protein